MKSLIFLAALAASTNALALFPRTEVPCCFHLNVSGDVTGPLGQLTDGKSRESRWRQQPESIFVLYQLYWSHHRQHRKRLYHHP
jgi:hypothetical protein